MGWIVGAVVGWFLGLWARGFRWVNRHFTTRLNPHRVEDPLVQQLARIRAAVGFVLVVAVRERDVHRRGDRPSYSLAGGADGFAQQQSLLVVGGAVVLVGLAVWELGQLRARGVTLRTAPAV